MLNHSSNQHALVSQLEEEITLGSHHVNVHVHACIYKWLLTCSLEDVSEDIVGSLLSTFNELNPLFDAAPAYCSDGSGCLPILSCFEWM